MAKKTSAIHPHFVGHPDFVRCKDCDWQATSTGPGEAHRQAVEHLAQSRHAGVTPDIIGPPPDPELVRPRAAL
jgi:hypothetical protein